jgi:WD40 repeat protein
VKFWERATGRLIRTLEHPNEVLSIARSPDGKQIVSACMDGSARVWDAADGKLQATLPGPGAAISACFSPSADTLAVSHGDGSVRLWDLKSQELLATLTAHQGVAHHVTFSADGKLLASSGWTGWSSSGTSRRVARRKRLRHRTGR